MGDTIYCSIIPFSTLVTKVTFLFIAEGTLKTFPSVKKVTIMKHAPRFDQAHTDPRGLKPELAKFANATFDQLWFTSPYKERVQIGNHTLKVENTDSYIGKEALTRSIIEILNKEIMEPNQTKTSKSSSQDDSHLHCPQTEFQKRQTRRYNEVVRGYSPIKTQNRFSILGN